LQKLYDFELMLGGGALEGYGVDAAGEASVVAALGALADPEAFARRYDVEASARPLLFAMGDGNHSLATAKAIWEKAKQESDPAPDDPRRHALVELVNLHDAAMVFEPIHRVVFDIADGVDIAAELRAHFGDRAKSETVADVDAMIAAVDASTAEVQRFGFLTESTLEVIEVRDADSNLPVGSLKGFLDPFMEARNAHEVDYVHGTAALTDLGRKPRNAGFFLPGMDKNDLFKTVIVDGALPRKTFSMGEADEKRFYMECRRIK